MEDNNMMTPDTMEAELDSAWGEDSSDSWQSAEPEANQLTNQQEGTPAPEGNGKQTAADQQQEGLENQQTPYMIPYTYLGENKQMSAAEAPQYIQKGMHYDTVRAERDQLRQFRDQNQAAVEFLARQAQAQGMSVDQYLEQVQRQDLMRSGMSAQEADREIQMRQREATLNAKQAKINAFYANQANAHRTKQDRQAAIRKDAELFARAYPGVKAESFTKEVWSQVAKGIPLVGAYAMYESQQLKAQLAAERQNRANQQRTPGALAHNIGRELDELDRMWVEDD